MKPEKTNFSILLFILFELIIGILLLINPESFTRAIVIALGVILLAVGVLYLVRYLNLRKSGTNGILSLSVSIVTLIFGVICTFFSGLILALIAAIAVLFGLAIIASGIYKLVCHFALQKAGYPVSIVSLISAVAAVIFGLLVVFYPKGAAFSVWRLSGLLLLVEAVVDFICLLQMRKAGSAR